MTAIDDIAAERRRMTEPEHDEAHRLGQMAGAAACYLMRNLSINYADLAQRVRLLSRDLWPWAETYRQPQDHRADLVRAAALIVAEIERIDRAEALAKEGRS